MSLDLAAALRRHLLQRFPADRDYPRAALHAAGMPPLIGGFLDRTLDRWVEIERTQIRSDWFDFANPDVVEAEARFFGALSRTARVPAAAWKGTLGGTVDLVVRYLTTPARALTDAIFEGSADPLPADEVRARLAMFDAYPYFADIGGAYLERKRTDTLEPPDLFGLLDRIDRRVVSEFGPDAWVDLLAPLFALARHVPEFDGVPASLLKRFFEMKGEPDLAMPLGKHVDSALDEDALRSLIADVMDEGDPLGVASVRTNGHTPSAAEVAEPPAAIEPPVLNLPDAEDDAPDPAPADPAPADRAEPRTTEPEPATEPEPTAAPVLLDVEAVELEEDVAEPEPEPSAPKPSAAESSTPEDEREDAPSMEDEGEQPQDEGREDGDVAAEAGADEGDAVPLWQRFTASDDANVNAQYSDADATAPEEPSGAEPEGAPLWKRFFSRPDERPSPLPLPPEAEPAVAKPSPATPTPAASPARASSLEELERRVLGASTSGQRSRFVKHLFGGDAGKYATVLHTLDGVGTWTEASQVIARDVFRPFRINIYGEHAVAFTDAVEARFRN